MKFSRILTLIDIVVCICVIAVFVIVAIKWPSEFMDHPIFHKMYSILKGTPSLGALMISLVTLYLTIGRPGLKKPKLCKEIPDPEYSKSGVENSASSYFLRIKISNKGLTQAINCVGRLIEVQTKDTKLNKFDALNLFWRRQNVINGESTFNPLTIMGNGDFEFLDIVQWVEDKDEWKLRIALDPPMTLIHGDDEYSPGAEPTLKACKGPYCLKIGVYGENCHLEPFWLKLYKDKNKNKPLGSVVRSRLCGQRI